MNIDDNNLDNVPCSLILLMKRGGFVGVGS